MRGNSTVCLSAIERDLLTQVSEGVADPELTLRARIILQCATGASNREVASLLNITYQTAGKWRARFLAERMGGLTALRVHFVDGPGTDHTEAVLTATQQILENGERPTTRAIAARSGLSQSSVSRTLRALAVSPQIEGAPRLPDHVLHSDAAHDIRGIFIGSGTAILALMPTEGSAPTSPVDPGSDPFMESLRKAVGKRDLEAACGDDPLRQTKARDDFLDHVVTAAGGRALHLISALPPERNVARSLRHELSRRHRNACLHPLPPGISWLKLCAGWHAVAKLNPSHHTASLTRQLAGYLESPRPEVPVIQLLSPDSDGNSRANSSRGGVGRDDSHEQTA